MPNAASFGAEHEVLHAGLGRRRRIAIQRDECVLAERQELEPEIHRDEIACRDQQHHAEAGEQQQQIELADEELPVAQIRARIEAHGERHEQDEELQDRRHPVEHEHVVERGERRAIGQRAIPDERTGYRKRADREPVRHIALRLLQEKIDQKDQARRAEQKELGQHRRKVVGVEFDHVGVRPSTASGSGRYRARRRP
jgi:hypothetical protein